MEKILKKIEEMKQKETGLKEKLDKSIAKMAVIERQMREEIDELKNQISEFLDEKRILLGQFEEIKEQEKQCVNQSINPIELMQQRKRALEEEKSENETDSLEIKKTKYMEKRIPNWLLEVLVWIKRTEMANSKLSTSSWTFKQLCWPKLHRNVKPYYVKDPLGFYYVEDEFGNTRPILYRFQNGTAEPKPTNINEAEIIPIATIQPPEYILGFNEIYLWFLNAQVIEFMEYEIIKMDDILLMPTTDTNGLEGHQIMAIHRLLTIFSGKIFELDFNTMESQKHWDKYLSLFPYIFDEAQHLFLDVEDEACENFIINWLTKNGRRDGKYRFLWLCDDDEIQPEYIENIKNEFENATEPNTFLVIADSQLNNLPEFTIENENTGEVLTLYHRINEAEHCLARYPKGDENCKTKMEKALFDNDITHIYLSIEKFGAFSNA